MRLFGKILGRILLILALAIGLVYFFGPREEIDPIISFNPEVINEDIDLYLAKQEEKYSNITPGTEKRILWHAAKGSQTPISIVVMHGFSATSEEIRPVPDLVAEALEANIYFMRFKGHGRDGTALASAKAGDWLEDAAEAIEIGRKIGKKILVIATSMGGTIATISASIPELSEDVMGYTLVSPLYGVNNPAANLLSLPFARQWIPLVAGETRSWEPDNEGHGKYWTTSYPTVSALPMQAAINYANSLETDKITTPALFIYSEQDQVVDTIEIENKLKSWGGAVTVAKRVMSDKDDPQSHVIAGDIRSPTQTKETVEIIVNWVKKL